MIYVKVYAVHHKIQDFLKAQEIDGISIVDSPFEAHYIITGQYSKNNYHANLRRIIIPYTGHNGINLEDMRSADLKLFITPTRSKYVAEKAVALTLSLLGNIVNYHTLLKEGNWAERNSDSRKPWVSIQDKIVGLYGYGRINQIVHKMLQGFGCEFYTIDRHKDYPSDMIVVKNVTNLVQVCDVIIIAAPLNVETEGIFNEQLLSRMKHKYLINVGRGKIVDEKALYEALKSHKLGGYASDVWYNYPKEKEHCLPSSYPLHELDNVVLSNHSGGYTIHTNEEVNADLVKQLIKLRDEDDSDQLDLEELL